MSIRSSAGGRPAICYSTKHSHTPGGGNWAAKAVYSLLKETRKAGRASDSCFALSFEEPGEVFNPLDSPQIPDWRKEPS